MEVKTNRIKNREKKLRKKVPVEKIKKKEAEVKVEEEENVAKKHAESLENKITKNIEINKNGFLKSALNKTNDDLDTSDEEDLRNTIGNVPLKWYDDYDHIGYDLEGKKIKKPAGVGKQDELDEFLNKMENPDYWRMILDRQTGEKVVLTDDDIDVIKRLSAGKYLSEEIDEFDTGSFFTQDEMKMPLSGRPEHKRSFIPSKWEKLQVGKYVHAIKMGWIKPRLKQPDREKFGEEEPKFYDLWGQENEEDKKRKHMHNLPAPKCPLPLHNESYNPPPEYLLDDDERAKWLNQEPEDRRVNFIPQKYSSLRVVPAYENLIKERFDRCLDMYLCPRQLKMRVEVNPEDLIPKLPKPKDLQPFPNTLSITYKGHKAAIQSISVHYTGQWLLSASNDKTVKCWEVSTGRCLSTWKFNSKCVDCVWIPNSKLCLIAVVIENTIVIINAKVGDKIIQSNTDSLMKEFDKANEENNNSQNKAKTNGTDDEPISNTVPPCTWKFYEDQKNDESYKLGHRILLTHQKIIKNMSCHPRGDYFSSVLDDKNSNSSVIMHQMSRQKSVRPFAKMSGIVQQVVFHPTKPILFVATQRYVKVYDLAKQILTKKLLTNVRWVSSLDIHPGGDNLIIGSYDNRLSWFDLDLSTKPYKTLKHHKKSIRSVAFHKKYPLFASASDDGTAIVSHGMVYDDLMQNALIVPLKILKGHELVNNSGITNCQFHPTQPWLFTCGVDKTIRLYSN